ncbi:MAG: TetR/AcrR family transcriptional regulator [Actinomycetota bacterium]
MPVRDAISSKEKILQAAFTEFSRCGFAGARVDEIAARAGVNKALLYQHYGDKEALFRLVLERKLAELGALGADPDRVVDVVGDFFDFHAKNPWLIRLTLWEALDYGTKSVPSEPERKKQLEERVATLQEAQRQGTVDPLLDARQTLFTLVGLVAFWFAVPQMARMTTDEPNPYAPDALAARRAHVIDAARRILEVKQ